MNARGDKQSLLFLFYHSVNLLLPKEEIIIHKGLCYLCKIIVHTGLGPRYTKPGLQAEKTELTIIQKEYSDDALSGYTVSSLKTVRHRYILFVFMVSSVFSACSPGLVYLAPYAAISKLMTERLTYKAGSSLKKYWW